MPAAKKKPTGMLKARQARVKKGGKPYTKAEPDYGYKKTSDAAMLKALVAAESQRQINRTIETQHSYAFVNMSYFVPNVSTGTPSMSGFQMIGLNQTYVPASGTSPASLNPTWNNMMVFNLSALCQIRTGTTPAVTGYRVGNKVNVAALTATINGGVLGPGADCTYYAMIAKRKDGGLVGQATTPSIVTSDNTSLWKSSNEGPLAAMNLGAGVNCPVPNYASTMRRNYDSWTFTQGAMTSSSVKIPNAGAGAAVDDTDYNAKVEMKLYHAFNEVWDYTQLNSNSVLTIKGGDYFFYLWREGPPDRNAQANLNVQFTLSFKDG